MWLNDKVQGPTSTLTRSRRAYPGNFGRRDLPCLTSPSFTFPHSLYIQSFEYGPRSRGKRNVDTSTFPEEAATVRFTISQEPKIHPRLLPKEVHQLTKFRTVSTHTSETDTHAHIIEKVVHPTPSLSDTACQQRCNRTLESPAQ